MTTSRERQQHGRSQSLQLRKLRLGQANLPQRRVPEKAEKEEPLARAKVGFLPIDEEAQLLKKSQDGLEIPLALVLRLADHENVVQVEDHSDSSGSQKGRYRFRHHREDERSGREAERNNQELEQFPVPTEPEEASRLTVKGNMKICVLQVH